MASSVCTLTPNGIYTKFKTWSKSVNQFIYLFPRKSYQQWLTLFIQPEPLPPFLWSCFFFSVFVVYWFQCLSTSYHCFTFVLRFIRGHLIVLLGWCLLFRIYIRQSFNRHKMSQLKLFVIGRSCPVNLKRWNEFKQSFAILYMFFVKLDSELFSGCNNFNCLL